MFSFTLLSTLLKTDHISQVDSVQNSNPKKTVTHRTHQEQHHLQVAISVISENAKS